MRNIFIPTGRTSYAGDYLSLLHTIGLESGTLGESENFQCNIHFPSRRFMERFPLVRVRGRLCWSFRCSYARCFGGYEITYKVYPGPSSIFMLIAAFICVCIGFSSFSDGDYQQLILGIVVGCILLLLCLFTRTMCIREFTQIFGRKS